MSKVGRYVKVVLLVCALCVSVPIPEPADPMAVVASLTIEER